MTIHMPLNDETRNLFNAKSIAEMKDDAIVLNMARGGIVNEKDMYEALKAGKIGGYASDVMENELAAGGLTEGRGLRLPCSSATTTSSLPTWVLRPLTLPATSAPTSSARSRRPWT